MRKARVGGLLFGMLPLLVASSFGQIIADSEAEFSGVQGQDGWSYGRFSTPGNAGTYVDFGHYTGTRWQPTDSVNNPWLNATGGHPGWDAGYYLHSPVRQYTIQPGEAGLVRLSGLINHTASTGDGTRNRIYLNGTNIQSRVAFTGQQPYTRVIPVHVGDVLHMEIFARNNVTDDTTTFTLVAELLRGHSLIADSMRGFSGTQNSAPGGWQYGHGIGGSFTTNGWTWSGTRWNGPELYQYLDLHGGHPGDSGGISVRRWTSDFSGELILEGNLGKDDAGSGDGVIGRIYRNGSEIWSHTIAGDTAPGAGFTLTNANVVAGDVFDFEIHRRNNVSNDKTTFLATFHVAPPQGTVIMIK